MSSLRPSMISLLSSLSCTHGRNGETRCQFAINHLMRLGKLRLHVRGGSGIPARRDKILAMLVNSLRVTPEENFTWRTRNSSVVVKSMSPSFACTNPPWNTITCFTRGRRRGAELTGARVGEAAEVVVHEGAIAAIVHHGSELFRRGRLAKISVV